MPEEGSEEQGVKVITCIQYDQTIQPLNRANLECMKKSSQTPGDWDLKPGDVSNKTKKADYFCHGILYPISALLFHSFVTLLAVLRRFYFTIQVDRTARI